MNTSRALVSHLTSVTDKDFRADHLKLCFLWYDEILIETIGNYDEKRFVERLLQAEPPQRALSHVLSDVIRPLDRQLQEHITGDWRSQAQRGYPRWGKNYENYTYPEPENAEQYAHNYLLGLIAQERGVNRFDDGYDVEQAEGRARIAVDAVTLWEGVNAELPCMFQANQDEKSAMTAAKQFVSASSIQDASFSLLEVAIPSLIDVPWSDIVQFRNNGSLKSLRDKIAQSVASAGADLEAAKSLFDRSEQEAIDAMLERSRPRVKRVAIESILANLPGMAVNPFSLFFGVRDTAEAYKRNQENGWLYLLRDIKRVAIEKK
ncbi:MAG: hypothetical protein KF909_09170 [Rhodocyclaceae bacterium]|nr:hypothetical protein [Rhodocyclaceae bacterium]